MEPSANFIKSVINPKNKSLIEKGILRIKNEFEIFSYVSDRVPRVIQDQDWNKMLRMTSTLERVNYWLFLALKEYQGDNDTRRRQNRKEKIAESSEFQRQIYDSGGMGYGTGLYSLIRNPLRRLSDLDFIGEQRICSSYCVPGMPKLALDLQFLPLSPYKHVSRLSLNMKYFISENRLKFMRPFVLEFINANRKVPAVSDFFTQLGVFDRTSFPLHFAPDVHADNPYANKDQNVNAVYISRHAREMLDGPLKHDAYILPVTFDCKRESVGAARSGNIRLMSLPFKKYVKWQAGPQFLPLTNIQKVLNTVSLSGGDWHTALHENISMRHLQSGEEKTMSRQIHNSIAQQRKIEKENIVNMIVSSIGNCDSAFV